MKNYLHKAKHHLKKPFIYIPLALIILLGGYSVYASSKGNSSGDIEIVQAGDFVQQVAVTGKVVSAQDVNLGFETSGRISRVNVKVGDKVQAGQVLASVSNGDFSASIAQRQAIVEAEQAKLEQLQRGSRPEDITLAQSDVDSAQSSINQAKRTLVDQIKDAYVKMDDSLRNRIDQLYSYPRTASPEIISFDTSNLGANFRYKLNDERVRAGEISISWQTSLNTLTPETYTSIYIDQARLNSSFMSSFLNDLSIVVSSLQPNSSVTQATIDKYKSDISQARTNISLASANLSSAEQSFMTAQSSLKRAQDQLALKKAGSTIEDINAQAAQVKSAQAQVQSAQAAYGKTVITAPIAGLVTKVDTKAGEISSPNTPVISLSSASKYEMESYVSETDIAKVKVGQTAKVTLDAYGKDVVFDATVTEVDPAETIKDGVSTYKTKFQFKTDDERIKSGMTANITIETAHIPNAIIIPQQAVSLKNDTKYVQVVDGKNTTEKPVTTGGVDTQGNVLITSGLTSGEKILVKALVK